MKISKIGQKWGFYRRDSSRDMTRDIHMLFFDAQGGHNSRPFGCFPMCLSYALGRAANRLLLS